MFSRWRPEHIVYHMLYNVSEDFFSLYGKTHPYIYSYICKIIRNKKQDGTYRVFIRCTHNRTTEYIKTEMYINIKQTKSGEIKDYDILGICSGMIKEYKQKLMPLNISGWTAKRVIEFVTTINNGKTPFIPFCKDYIKKLYKEERDRSAGNYDTALNSFCKFFGEQIHFQEITTLKLKEWIESLKQTKRAKEMYPVYIRKMFEEGRNHFNEYDLDIIRIINDPFKKVQIPRSEQPQKRAVEAESIRKILTVKPDSERALLAQDVAKLIIYLVGINTVDLFFMEKKALKNGKLCYNRRKTKGHRKDKAYIEVAIREEIKEILKKYKSGSEKLFAFNYYSEQGFNNNVNKGLKRLCEIAEIPKITTYTLRHSWATIAYNDCGISEELIAFCLNHQSAHKITAGYIKKDFSIIDKTNEKVLNFIFSK